MDVNYKVINIPSLDSLLSGVRPIKVKNPDREKFYDDLRISYSLRNFKYLDKNKEDKVEYNDVVEISSKSSNKKFNSESIWITVGRNAFNKEFEENIMGLKAGDEKKFTVENENVNVTIKSITKKYYGEVSLEDIHKEYPDIKSAEQFLVQEYEKKCDEVLEERVNKLIVSRACGKLLHTAEIEFDEDSLKQYIDEQFKQADTVVIPEGIPEETRKYFDITPLESKIRMANFLNDTLGYLTGVENKADYKNLPEEELNKALRENIYKDLLYKTINKEFAKSVGFIPTKEEYDKYMEESATHYGGTVEDYIKASGYTFEIYSEQTVNDASIYFFKNYAYKNLIAK